MNIKHELQPFFEAELEYHEGMEPIVSSEGRISEPLGSGIGVIKGNHLSGMIRWTIFEITGNPCETNIIGRITTNDGDEILIDSKGFGLVPEKSRPHLWQMSAALKFSTKSNHYQWLNKTIALWDGAFDSKRGKHIYKAYRKHPSEHN